MLSRVGGRLRRRKHSQNMSKRKKNYSYSVKVSPQPVLSHMVQYPLVPINPLKNMVDIESVYIEPELNPIQQIIADYQTERLNCLIEIDNASGMLNVEIDQAKKAYNDAVTQAYDKQEQVKARAQIQTTLANNEVERIQREHKERLDALKRGEKLDPIIKTQVEMPSESKRQKEQNRQEKGDSHEQAKKASKAAKKGYLTKRAVLTITLWLLDEDNANVIAAITGMNKDEVISIQNHGVFSEVARTSLDAHLPDGVVFIPQMLTVNLAIVFIYMSDTEVKKLSLDQKKHREDIMEAAQDYCRENPALQKKMDKAIDDFANGTRLAATADLINALIPELSKMADYVDLLRKVYSLKSASKEAMLNQLNVEAFFTSGEVDLDSEAAEVLFKLKAVDDPRKTFKTLEDMKDTVVTIIEKTAVILDHKRNNCPIRQQTSELRSQLDALRSPSEKTATLDPEEPGAPTFNGPGS